MLSPGFRKVLDKILFACSNTGIYNNYYCSLIKMSEPKWKIEKYRLLKMTPDDRKKAGMYVNKTIITVNMVDPWKNYVIRNKHIEKERIHNMDDLTEFMKIKIDPEQNKELSQRVSIFKGDITQLEVSAIVNAANAMLKAGGGVDGAIHRAAGPLLQDECNTLKGCPTGEAKITCGYNLPATYVIHTVGPQDGNAEKLAKCYENSLAFHKTHKLTSIAFPCISTGIYGFPNRLAAHIALKTARKFLEQNPEMERIIFCLFMPIDVEIYETLMQIYFPVHEWNHPDDVRHVDTEKRSLQGWEITQALYGECFTGVPYISGPDMTGDWVDLHHPYKPKTLPLLRHRSPLSEEDELVNIVKEVENNAVSTKSPTTNSPPSSHLWAVSSPPLMFMEEEIRKSSLLSPTRPTLNVYTRGVQSEHRQSVQATNRRARKRTRRLLRRNFKEQQHRDKMILLREKNRIRAMKIQAQKDWQANVKKALNVIEKICKGSG